MKKINRYFKKARYKLIKLVSRKISVQMLIVLVLVVSIPLSVLGLLLIKTSQDAIRASVLRGHQQLAIRAASEIGLFIQQPKELLIATASILGVSPTQAWNQETVLTELALNNPIFNRVSSVDSNGIEIATSELGSELKVISDDWGFIRAMSGQFHMSDVYIADNHMPYIKLAVPIERLGRISGVLFAEVNLRGIWDIVDKIKLGNTGITYVVSDKGILIAHPDKKRVLDNEDMSAHKIVRTVLNSGLGSIEYLDDQKQRQIGSFTSIPSLGWAVVVVQSASEAFMFSRLMKTQSWVLIILSELIAIIISILIARALVKPIKALAEATKQVAQGRLDRRIPFRRRDELGGLVHAFNDMTKKLKQAKASERLSIIGKAATAMVHELKNSLVMVNTFVGLFPRKHKDQKFVEKFSRIIPQELQRWKAMLQDLSDFSRGEKTDLQLKELDIAELIQDIHCLIEEKTAQGNIKLEVSMARELPRIRGNEQKLKQVFINLITNAIDAMPNQGSLTISAAMANGNDKHKPNHLEIRVKDTGRGIPLQSFEQIFEPFHSTKSNGMGLGLAISRNIIQQHGGDIKVESTPGQGSSFIIRLPVVTRPSTEKFRFRLRRYGIEQGYENRTADKAGK